MRDVYFTPEYGKLYEPLEKGDLECFSYSDSAGEVYYQYLKRPIPYQLDGQQYYDAMTPYGYGGPLVLRAEKGRQTELVNGFRIALNEHFQKERIICEFVRFHPTQNNAQFFSEMYQLRNCRTAVYTDLSAEDPVSAEFHPDTVRNIRRAIKKGMTTSIHTNPTQEQMELFLECYYANMQAINASEYYYFSKEYFRQMWQSMNDRLILVLAWQEEQVVGADLGFSDDGIYTRHLSGVTDLGRKLGAARVMAGAQVRWAKEHGYKLVFHGCGLSGREDDPLLKFKMFFTRGTCYKYWQGARICNDAIYQKMCEISGNTEDDGFFPAYRKP